VNVKLDNLSDKQSKELLPEGLILLAYRGSIAHGVIAYMNNSSF